MPFDALLRLEEAPVEEEVAGESGRSYRMKVCSFWDMEPYESELYTRVGLAGRGWRAHQRYHGVETRSPEDDFAPRPEADVWAGSNWTEIAAWTILLLVLLAIVAVFVAGVVFLVSLIF